MIRHLLAKDVRLAGPYAWVVLPVHVLWCAQAFLVPELYFWLSLWAALSWTAVVMSVEWQIDADRLVASLPVTRATIVLARYASAMAGLALGAALYAAYGHAMFALLPERMVRRWDGRAAWASAEGILAFLAVGYVAVVGFLPLRFRFGLPVGSALFAVVATAATSAVVALPWGHDVRAWLSLPSVMPGEWPVRLALLVGAAALGLASARLSIRFYEGRDL
jgi:ABC-2 family transporter protein